MTSIMLLYEYTHITILQTECNELKEKSNVKVRKWINKFMNSCASTKKCIMDVLQMSELMNMPIMLVV